MTDAADLMHAICADPADTTLWLAYADFCEERGDAGRAAFIRVQCELATAPRNPHGNCSYCGVMEGEHREGCRAGDLHRREGELLEAHWHPWSGIPAATYCGNFHGPGRGAFGVTFRRGFVAEVSCTVAAWCGGACRRCDSTGLVECRYDCWDRDRRRTRGGFPVTDCPACRGTGTMPAHGPAVVLAAPVELLTMPNVTATEAARFLAFARRDAGLPPLKEDTP